MDVHVALKRLMDASKGKAFKDLGSRVKAIHSVHVDARLDADGTRRFSVTVFARDHSNTNIASEQSLGAAFTKAMQRIERMPSDPGAQLAATLGLTPDGKIAA